MAEESERVKQHTYQLNSNLVIQRDRTSRLEIGPSDEVKTLSKIAPEDLQGMFGSSVKQSAPPIEKRKAKKRPKQYSTKRLKGDVLEEQETFGYKPKTLQTKRVYDVLINIVSKMFPGDSHDLIKSCTDLALETLKNENLKLSEKKKKLEKLLKSGALGEDQFSEIFGLAKKITDFDADDDAANNEDIEVPIEFDDDADFREVAEPDESENSSSERDEEMGRSGKPETENSLQKAEDDKTGNGDVKKENATPIKKGHESGFEGARSALREADLRQIREAERQEKSKMVLSTTAAFDIGQEEISLVASSGDQIDLKEIGAYWLQKKISVFFKDPLEAQERAQKVLATIERERDLRFCENKLVDLLGFEAFDFIKVLIKNRFEILYCTKLAQSSEAERKKLESAMKKDPQLKSILERLKRKNTTPLDRTKRIREDLRAQAASLRKLEKAEGGEGERGEEEEENGGTFGEQSDISFEFKRRINLDLDSISFKNGGRTNTNKNWTLPEASKKIQKKGYMEIYIPYKKRDSSQQLCSKSIEDLPDWAKPSFSAKGTSLFKRLNHVQSKCFTKAFESDENMLLCAPTGAGKTVVAQLCMLREIGKHFDKNKHLKLNEFKIVYIAPMKSLVREMVSNFSRRFEKYGICVRELSGDRQLSQEQIYNTQIIVTTPEKWDIITRKSGERTYTQLVKLLIIDEIHLLHDSRGPVLESIVARSMRQVTTAKASLRIVGLSATLPNYENVAVFLRAPEENVFFFDQGYRPCPLTQCFVGIAGMKPYRQMEMMNEIAFEKTVAQRKKQQQVLIFVHSRRETYNTAKFMREKADEEDCLNLFMEENSSKEVVEEELDHIKDSKLQEVLADGIAIHHAGLSAADRRVVEDLFLDRHISVLVSTATLAWGVNLPAHCVVIKGTQVYSPEKGRWTELSMLDVMQMTGRAGRPGLDSYGEAFILTTQKELKYYMSLLTEQLPIESQLVNRLPDMLNAEIVLGTVRNVQEAIEWLTFTYLFVRMLANPELYGVPVADIKTDPELRQRRVDLINSAAILLDKSKLVHYDRKGAQFQMTEFGRIAAHYYLSNETMKTFREHTKKSMSEIEILRVFSLAQEFSFVTIREEEKLEMAKLLDKVPIPVKENTEEPTAKVNVLLQAYISRLKLSGYQLQADMQYVTQSAGRLMRALFAITARRGWAAAARRCLELCKCIEWRMWSVESPIRQFSDGIAPVVFRRIERKEFPWERWRDLKPHEIGTFIDHSAQGKKVYNAVHSVPALRVGGQVQPITRSLLRIELTLNADFKIDSEVHYVREPFWIFVEDIDGENFVHFEYFLLNTRLNREQTVSFAVPLSDPLPPQYFIRVVSDRFLGSETMLPISLTSLILPSKFPPPTELLDFTAQPVSAINSGSGKDKDYVKMYSFKTFNAVQTQTFNALYKSTGNVLVCAPTSSGKTACLELALLKFISEKTKDEKCVYVAPKENVAQLIYDDWLRRFGRIKNPPIIAMLTGDLQYDQKLLGSADIVVSDAASWNPLQRRWRRRRAVQNVRLFLMDEMHMLTSAQGHIFEECVSRMRYIASQIEQPVRFVGAATSVANAQDLGEWIGCKPSHVFSFAPDVRPVRLDLSISSFETTDFDARLLAMEKPAFRQIVGNAEGKPVLVFAPSRRATRQIAMDFVRMVAQEKRPEQFVRVAEEDMAFELRQINNTLLKTTLKRGVAFLHGRMSRRERQAVLALFRAGAVQVLVAEQSMCWGLDVSCFMVLVLGTKRFDGTTQEYADYAVFDLLQMLGRAGRAGQDERSKAVVFCEAPRKEFLRKFLYEPLPVESALDSFLADYMNAEVVSETIESIQEAVDFLTWTFLYRRLHQNPNFYSLFGTSNTHVSEYLSKLSEETLDALKAAGCVKLTEGGEDEVSISALNLGHIASYYNVQFGTVEVFVSMLDEDMDLKRVLEVLVSAEEFLDVPVRRNEEADLRRLMRSAPLAPTGQQLTEARTKVHLLLQAHFSRERLQSDLAFDRDEALKLALRLLFAMVDVIATNGWLKPTLAAMELCQMVTQAMWDSDSPLLQLPHVDRERAQRLQSLGVEEPLDFSGEREDELKKELSLEAAEFDDVVAVANDFPNPELAFALATPPEMLAVGEAARIECELRRDEEEEDSAREEKVFSPRFPQQKSETWWVLIGDPERNRLLGIKRLALVGRKARVKLDFVPQVAGKQRYFIYLMADSYLGVDQEYQLELAVGKGKNKQ